MLFPDEEFDRDWTRHAAMNIPNRVRLYEEIHRVLKPDRRLAIHGVAAGEKCPPHFPLPWAETAEVSFLLNAVDMRDVLTDAGFTVLSWEDKAAVTLAGPQEGAPGDAGPQGVGVRRAAADA